MTPEELRIARKAKNLTQAEMARHVGVTRKSYNRWERGHVKDLPGDLAARVVAPIAYGTETVNVCYDNYPQWYDKHHIRGVRPNASHPTGFSGEYPRAKVEAFLRGEPWPRSPAAPETEADTYRRRAMSDRPATMPEGDPISQETEAQWLARLGIKPN